MHRHAWSLNYFSSTLWVGHSRAQLNKVHHRPGACQPSIRFGSPFAFTEICIASSSYDWYQSQALQLSPISQDRASLVISLSVSQSGEPNSTLSFISCPGHSVLPLIQMLRGEAVSVVHEGSFSVSPFLLLPHLPVSLGKQMCGRWGHKVGTILNTCAYYFGQ